MSKQPIDIRAALLLTRVDNGSRPDATDFSDITTGLRTAIEDAGQNWSKAEHLEDLLDQVQRAQRQAQKAAALAARMHFGG